MPRSKAHPTAIIEDGARARRRRGDRALLRGRAARRRSGAGVKLVSHVVVAGRTKIGAGTRIFPFASIGSEPQDLKYKGEHSTLEIGAHCTIREGVTMNPGTAGGGSVTTVGDKCTFLANSHVAHDCRVGNNVIFSNNVMLAGHCTVGDFAILGGGAGVHQFVRIGASCLHRRHVRGGERRDPLRHGARQPCGLAGLNIVGLKRRGFSRDRHPEPASRLPAAVRQRGHAGGAARPTSRRTTRQGSRCARDPRLHQAQSDRRAVRAARGLSAVDRRLMCAPHPQRTRMRGLQAS